jgi:hypothetical protein
MHPLVRKTFYMLKPMFPRRAQLALRRRVVALQRERYASIWPIDPDAGSPPDDWPGWPEGKRFALVLTHDVDTQKGSDSCRSLLALEQKMGFRSSFNFVAKRYNVSEELRNYITSQGFEVGVHGLYHDGKYFDSREEFDRRAREINRYLKAWGAVGYRTPSMHHNLGWILDLDILYDASTFDTDPFEPQSEGVRTIFPSWYGEKGSERRGYVELPYTLSQDFTLFVLMKESSIAIWKTKLDWIVEKGGMALINTHPDYMNFDDGPVGSEEYSYQLYREFLEYLKKRYEGEYWNALPREVARFWVENMVETSANCGQAECKPNSKRP